MEAAASGIERRGETKDLEISMLTHTVDGLWQIELTAKAHSAKAAESLIRILQEVMPLLAENDQRIAERAAGDKAASVN